MSGSRSSTPTHVSDSYSEYSYELLPHTNIFEYKPKTKSKGAIADDADTAKSKEDVPTEDLNIGNGKRKSGIGEYESSSKKKGKKKNKEKSKGKSKLEITDDAAAAKSKEDLPSEEEKIGDRNRKVGGEEYESSTKKKGEKNKEKVDPDSFELEFPSLCYASEYLKHPKFIQEKYHMMGREAAVKLDNAWTDITAAELELHVERLKMLKKALKYYFK